MKTGISKRDLILISTLLIAGYIIFHTSFSVLPTTDAQRYAVLAQNLILKKGYTLNSVPELIYPPGYSFTLVPFIFLGLSLDVSVAILSGISFVFLGFFLLKCLEKYFDYKTALISSIFILINGNIILWILVGIIEPLWLAGLMSTLYFLSFNDKKNKFVSGTLAGYTYLLKPETLGYLAIVILIITSAKKVKLKSYLYFIVPFVIIIFSYSLWLYIHSGRVSISGKTATLHWDTYVENSAITRDELAGSLRDDGSVGITIKDLPDYKPDLLKRIKNNFPAFKKSVFELLLPLRLVIFAFAASLIFLKKARKLLVYMTITVTPVFGIFLFHIENRYLMPVLILGIVFLSFSMLKFAATKSAVNKFFSLFLFFVLLMTSYYSYLPLRAELKSLIDDKKEIIEVTDLIATDKKVILSRKPNYSFYLEKDFYQLPWTEDYKDIQKYLSGKDNFILILDDWSKNTISKTHSLIEENFSDLGLKVIKYDKKDISVLEKI